MTYRHFDLTEVEHQIRGAAERGLMRAMSNAKTDTERHGYELQHQMFEAQTAAQLQVFAMVNQGESADMIAKTVGMLIANMIAVALSVSDATRRTGEVIEYIISDALASISGGGDGSVHVAKADITATRGGRA